jgi:alpha-ketoglutarate-dependent taurine dioxygenase
MKTQHYGMYTGRIVEASAYGCQLTSLEKNELFATLKESGYLILRGFDVDLPAFSQFVETNSSRVTLDPARKFSAANAQKVDAGYDEIGLHIENGAGPFVPELCWFFCKKAAKAGSQTTVCDGKMVLEHMPQAIKNAFRNRHLVYTRNVSEAIWKTFVLHHLPQLGKMENVTFAHVEAITQRIKGLSARLNDDMSSCYSFTIQAIIPSAFCQEFAFANSILGPSFNYEKPRITFEDGEELPVDLVQEVKLITDACTEDINWQDGDVVVINNTRVMHGRRRIVDTNRTIYNALSCI